jgi:hypothetical protein
MIQVAAFADVLGSPIWTVLATVLAAVAIAVTVILYRRQRSRKSLTYEVKVTQLVNVHSAAKDRIKIYFEDEQIEQVHLVEARLENSGNVPILEGDFERPVSFNLGPGATPLTVDVSSLRPAELAAEINLDGNEVQLMPLLLNPSDGLTLKILVRNLGSKVQCQYRIVGITQMIDAQRQAQRQAQLTLTKRLLSELPELTGFAAAGIVALGVLSLLGVVGGDEKNDTVVQLASGESRCGKVLQANDRRVVLQLANSGKIRSISMSEIESIKDRSC